MTRRSEVGKLRIQSERASWWLELWLRWYRRCGYALLEGPAFRLHSEPSMSGAFSRRAPRNPSTPDALRLAAASDRARLSSIVRRKGPGVLRGW